MRFLRLTFQGPPTGGGPIVLGLGFLLCGAHSAIAAPPNPHLFFERDTASDAWTPRQDTPGFSSTTRFGSAHSTGVNMVFCDGSARAISFNIHKATHGQLGNRHDKRLKVGTPYIGPPDLSGIFD